MDESDESGESGGGDGDGVDIIAFPDAEAFEGWPAEHWARAEGVWVKAAGKKRPGTPSVTDDELVDIGLYYGWISGQRRSLG
ncbi:hypothetical protein NJL88_02000 [Streptomyces sp. DK15]|uniref:hypothetical protein n=1 Tax=Streptomyces sp. DK15 TaxID=2957499 RepID=UPI0029BE974D|nr:hypothetical protein [Streptomyces sp. DK15]MDX2388877.1 hypothetical protein [Streptomyces sp. DK15]